MFLWKNNEKNNEKNSMYNYIIIKTEHDAENISFEIWFQVMCTEFIFIKST